MTESEAERAAGEQSTVTADDNKSTRRAATSIVALVLAIGAMALAAWAVLRPGTFEVPNASDGASATFDDSERVAAEQKLCGAFETVRRGVSLNTNASAPGGPEDVAGGLAVAANARLALYGGGEYLLARIDDATPEELATTSRDLANTLLDIGAASISGVPTSDPSQTDRLRNAEDLSAAIAEQCANS